MAKKVASKKTAKKADKSSKKIKIAIAGIGNCCSSLVQGIYYYKDIKSDDELVPGLMTNAMISLEIMNALQMKLELF
jgi:myo-inositol-1-phosphate synthase